jgi:pimeloyl-ACP methyl ester carboxylesterase
MRPLESALLIVAWALLICYSRRGSRGWALIAWLSLPLLLVLHLTIEGGRWHLASGYLAIGILLGCAWPRVLKLGIWAAVLLGTFLLGAAVLGTALPVFDFPTPTGECPIGSATRHLIDKARAEAQAGPGGACRELMIKLWYPAEHSGPRDYYRAGTPPTLTNQHLRLIKLSSSTGAPVAKAPLRFPVVILLPAWTATSTQYTFLAQELASHGFLVVGIDHPYASDPTVFPDGRVVHTRLTGFLDYGSDAALKAGLAIVDDQLRIRAADVRFTLDELERWDRSDPHGFLTGRLDLARVAVCGHSFGGAVAAEVCATDPRLKAGINLDGFIFGTPTTQSIGKPFLFFTDDTVIPAPAERKALPDDECRRWSFMADNVASLRKSLGGGSAYWLNLGGAHHVNFHDRALYTPIRHLTHAGPIDPLRAMKIVNAYVLAFLETHLEEKANRLLEAPSPLYPEVKLERLSPTRAEARANQRAMK